MSLRKFAHRTPTGQISRRGAAAKGHAPTEIVRLRDAALAGIRDPLWGSQLGILHLTGKVTAGQLAAGKRFLELIAKYSAAMRSPIQPCTVRFDASGGGSYDSESDDRELRQHRRAVSDHMAACAALRGAGPQIERAVRHVVEHDCAPVGTTGLLELQVGLERLAALFSGKRKAGGR